MYHIKCRNCKYFVTEHNITPFCIKRSPKVFQIIECERTKIVTRFPEVRGNDYCGDFVYNGTSQDTDVDK